MPQFTMTRQIDAPCDTVFRLLSDFENAPRRIRGIKKIEMLTDGPVGKGTRFRETRIVFKKESTEEMEVLEFDPPRRYVLGGESCGCRFRTEFRVERAGRGAEVHMTLHAQPLTFFAGVMSIVMSPIFKMCMKECAKDLDDLKASVESDNAPGDPDTGSAGLAESL